MFMHVPGVCVCSIYFTCTLYIPWDLWETDSHILQRLTCTECYCTYIYSMHIFHELLIISMLLKIMNEIQMLCK